jgi:hypothetical protein
VKAQWVLRPGVDQLLVGNVACANIWEGVCPEDTENPDGAWIWAVADERDGIPWVLVGGLPLSGNACSEEKARANALDAVRSRLKAALAALDGAQ